MSKILTISIAAYNMEAYIEKTLISLIDDRVIDELEIFVVDDGGTDRTLEIIKKYALKYPKSVFPIHKENGGYGSTVNFSIKYAMGRYFKLLDGDDWFDTENLVRLVKELSVKDSDIILNDYYAYRDDEVNKSLVQMQGYENKGKVVVRNSVIPKGFGMWAITYKTELLKKAQIDLPHHTLYTDRIYSTIPFAYAKTIEYLSFPVYCYRLGRAGQSVSSDLRVKHLDETLFICTKLCSFYEEQKINGNENYPVLLTMIARHYATALHTLLLLPIKKENFLKIRNYEKLIKSISGDIFDSSLEVGNTGKFFHLLRRTGYRAYWLLKIVPKSKLDFKL